MELICPICAERLDEAQASLRCAAGHSFDIARQGYVNLLPVQQKHSRSPGDTRQQVAGRRAFLEGGYYAPLARAVEALVTEHHCTGPIVDVGCGEGYYSVQLAQALGAELVGLDISKEAVRCAAGRHKGYQWLCASGAHLPLPSHSAGLVTSLFSMTADREFARVLRPDGHFLQVLAAEDHLLALKSVIYPQLHEKKKEGVRSPEGFRLLESRPVSFSFTVEAEQVQNLLNMTPHVYRIGPEGARRLAETPRLTDRASCVLNLFTLA